jgi:hypothetical protein
MVPPVHKGITRKKKWTVQYPNIPSAICPVSHYEGLPISEPTVIFSPASEEEEEKEYT